ncbi:hypothetical protein L2719_11500 [Shewanella schlegeliana]|uniref:Outer membrane protein beta-barrel domain-containing protein n=1 Tax=Shewanella schlegeliana TaxID=190308 RepID=A0ABS1STN4_9GAMM|nr:hypothetical protein [Shewanella schlegeliana]MBL4911873.1 hypothetical protein [Shewanella schlegeliana]MCL1110174.1 hypothetical protein [Shewanella schlegeliana]GIU27070.1 DUF481 domain-containing protein [Shewanella schlegeliana]
MVKSFIIRSAATMALVASPITFADNSTVIRVGGFYANTDSTIDVNDPILGNEFVLDFEADLKLEESQFLPFFEFSHHFNDRHTLYADWKQLHRSALVQSVEKPFQFTWDDTTYDIKSGISLDSTLNIDIMRVGYGYDIWQGHNYDVGVSVGLHAMFIKTAFKGNIGICDAATETRCPDMVEIPKVVDEKLTAPLPDVGLYGSYEFYPGFKLNGHAQYFYITLDDLKGGLVDVRMGVEAAISENWHMTAAFNYYEVDVEYTSTITAADIKIADYNIYYSFIGPMLSVSYQF